MSANSRRHPHAWFSGHESARTVGSTCLKNIVLLYAWLTAAALGQWLPTWPALACTALTLVAFMRYVSPRPEWAAGPSVAPRDRLGLPLLGVAVALAAAYHLSAEMWYFRIAPVRHVTETFLDRSLEKPFGWLTVVAYTVLYAPLVEEVVFRGRVQPALQRTIGTAPAVALTAVLYTIAHLDAWASPLLLAGGLLFGLAAAKTGTIWTSLAMHIGSNAASKLASALAGDERTPADWAPALHLPTPVVGALAALTGTTLLYLVLPTDGPHGLRPSRAPGT